MEHARYVAIRLEFQKTKLENGCIILRSNSRYVEQIKKSLLDEMIASWFRSIMKI